MTVRPQTGCILARLLMLALLLGLAFAFGPFDAATWVSYTRLVALTAVIVLELASLLWPAQHGGPPPPPGEPARLRIHR